MNTPFFKFLLFTLFCAIVPALGFSQDNQGKYTSENIDASLVPDAVKAAQEGYFPGWAVSQWKKNTLVTKEGATFYQFEAWYLYEKKQIAKAHYGEDGKGQFNQVFYGAAGLPVAVKNGAAKLYPGYTITTAQFLRVFSSNREGYKVNLKKGTQKVEIWLDKNGAELNQAYINQALKDLWGVE